MQVALHAKAWPWVSDCYIFSGQARQPAGVLFRRPGDGNGLVEWSCDGAENISKSIYGLGGVCPGHDERSKVIEYSHFAPEMPLLWMKPCEETGRPRGQILVDWASRLAQQLAPPALHATAWIGKIIRVHANLLARRQERRQ